MNPISERFTDATKSRYQPVSYVIESENESTQNALSHDTRPRQHGGWYRTKAVTIKTWAYATVVIVPLALAIWLPQSMRTLTRVDIFESTPLGGSLTLTQAKAIDFVSSAVLAPLLLSVLNYVWFKNARTAIADERRDVKSGTSLYALVEASCTSSGSYDFFKIWTLCCSRSGRLFVFAILALLSALGKSTLSNIIAYEAITELTEASSSQLRLLTGPLMITSNQGKNQSFVPARNGTWTASHDQRKVYVQETTGVLQGVAWQNSTTQLNSSAYIALNITTADLANLNTSVKSLYNVPAIRATAECKPHNVSNFILWQYNKGVGFQMMFDRYTDDNMTAQNDNWYQTNVGTTTDILVDGSLGSSSYQSLDFLAYDLNNRTSMLVGCLGANVGGDPTWTEPNLVPIQSSLGEIFPQPFANFSMDSSSDSGGYTMFIWSIACTINQQSGLVNLSRDSNGDDWHQSTASWSADYHTNPSVLSGLEDVLGTMNFVSGKSGLGPALTPSAQVQACNTSSASTPVPSWCTQPGARRLDFKTLADNLLYAEMEIQRVAYEVAAMNQSLADPEMFASLATFGDVLKYRITYIPALLFAGMICVFFAAVATVALMIYSGRSVASRTFRHVDSIRLLVDYSINNYDAKLTSVARSWNDDELQSWASKHMVRYEGYQDTNGQPSTLVLRSVDGHVGKEDGRY